MLCPDDANAYPQLANFYNLPVDDADATTCDAYSPIASSISELPQFMHTPHPVPAAALAATSPTSARPRRSLFVPFDDAKPIRHINTRTSASVTNLSMVTALSVSTGTPSAAKEAALTALLVRVTHIDTPYRFFVKSIDFNTDDLREQCLLAATRSVPPTRIECDALYLMLDKSTAAAYTGTRTGNVWHRVRVLNSRPGPNRSEYKVFYIDVGHTERVQHLSRFRTIDQQLAARPPAVRMCWLHSVRPVTSDSKEACSLMASIVGQ